MSAFVGYVAWFGSLFFLLVLCVCCFGLLCFHNEDEKEDNAKQNFIASYWEQTRNIKDSYMDAYERYYTLVSNAQRRAEQQARTLNDTKSALSVPIMQMAPSETSLSSKLINSVATRQEDKSSEIISPPPPPVARSEPRYSFSERIPTLNRSVSAKEHVTTPDQQPSPSEISRSASSTATSANSSVFIMQQQHQQQRNTVHGCRRERSFTVSGAYLSKPITGTSTSTIV